MSELSKISLKYNQAIYHEYYNWSGSWNWRSGPFANQEIIPDRSEYPVASLKLSFEVEKDFLQQQATLKLNLPVKLNSRNVREKNRKIKITITDEIASKTPSPVGKVYGSFNLSFEAPTELQIIPVNIQLEGLETKKSFLYVYFEEENSYSTGSSDFVAIYAEGFEAFLEYFPISQCLWQNGTIILSDSYENIYMTHSGPSPEFSWNGGKNGINNEVAGYRITWYEDFHTEKVIYGSQDVVNNTFVIPKIGGEYKRGQSITVDVQIIGNTIDTRYRYSEPITAILGCINNLPEISVSYLENTVQSNGQVSFTINIIDPDNQNQTYFVKIDDQQERQYDIYPLEFNVQDLSLSPGLHSITFQAYDGLERGNVVTRNFQVNSKPQIEAPQIVHNILQGFSSIPLATNSVITYELNKNISPTNAKIKLKLKNVETGRQMEFFDPSFFNGDFTSKRISINLSSLLTSSSFITNGDKYQYSFSIYDGVEWSDYTDYLEAARYPSLPPLPQYTISGDGNSNLIEEDFFSSGIQVELFLPYPDEDSGYLYLSEFQLKGTQNSFLNEEEVLLSLPSQHFTLSYGESKMITIPIVEHNVSTTNLYNINLNLESVDTIGQRKQAVITGTNGTNFSKSYPPVFAEGAFASVSLEAIKPLSNTTNVVLSHTAAICEGSLINYIYKAKIDSEEKIVEEFSWNQLGQTVEISILANKINQLLKEMVTDYNKKYTVAWQIIAEDGFGRRISLTTSNLADFQEEPYWSAGAQLSLKHDYDISNLNNQAIAEVPPVTLGEKYLDIRMFNSQEGIIFNFPKAQDLNNDIVQYQFFLSRQDLDDDINLEELQTRLNNPNNISFNSVPFLILTPDQLVENNNIYQYRYTASQYIKNEVFYFKICAKDSTGLISEPIFSNTYIIGCRTSKPYFEVKNYKLQTGNLNEAGEPTLITITNNLKINDLGGSALEFWREFYYNEYKNFERQLPEYSTKIGLKTEISLNSDFSYSLSRWRLENQNFLDFDEINFEANFQNPNEEEMQATTSPSIQDFMGKKIYVRFTLVISTGLQTGSVIEGIDDFNNLHTVLSVSRTFVSSGTAPTVAYRPHRVGINVDEENFSEHDVLTLSSYKNNKLDNYLVRMLGDSSLHGTAEEIEIIFNLAQGTMDGAFISGGTW